MSIESAVIMFVLLMVNTWWNYRQGFKKGAVGGHLVGVHDTLEYMIEKADLTMTVDNKPASLDEMTMKVLEELTERRAKKLEQQEA